MRKRNGFTLIEMLVACAIVITLAAMALPGILRYRYMGTAKRCIANIRLIQHARESYFHEHRDATAMTSCADVAPYLPLNSAKGELYENFKCGMNTYSFGTALTMLDTIVPCPNRSDPTGAIATTDPYYDHILRGN